MMKGILILILASVCSGIKYDGLRGIKYDGLRVKFSFNVDRTGAKNFFSIPRTVSKAEDEGWRLTERPPGPMPELKLYCKDYYVCTLYAATDFIAGIQVAFLKDTAAPELKLERYFTEWNPPAIDGKPQKRYLAATQYYVNEDFLKQGGPTPENGSTLQAGGVWFNDLNGKLMKMSTAENEIKPPYNKQLCIPYMGVHYYYNVSRSFDCSTVFLPFYALVTDGELAGVGFQTFVQKPPVAAGERDWFEDVPPQRNATQLSMPDGSDCLMDSHVKYGTLSLHIYFMDEPWNMKCDEKRLRSFTKDLESHLPNQLK